MVGEYSYTRCTTTLAYTSMLSYLVLASHPSARHSTCYGRGRHSCPTLGGGHKKVL
jgi:hypothetical protein